MSGSIALVAALLSATYVSAIVEPAYEPSPAGGSCECLDWKEVYGMKLVECGQGMEFVRYTKPHLIDSASSQYLVQPKLAYENVSEWLEWINDKNTALTYFQFWRRLREEICQGSLTQISDNSCVRVTPDGYPMQWYGQSWCYVEKNCTEATPVPTSGYAVKFCKEGIDNFLGEKTPEEIVKLGKREEVKRPGFFFKLAYPTDTSVTWRDRERATSRIEYLRKRNKTMVIDVSEEHERAGVDVVTKSEAQILREAPQRVDKMIIKGDKTWTLNSYDWKSVQCIEGCTESEKNLLKASTTVAPELDFGRLPF